MQLHQRMTHHIRNNIFRGRQNTIAIAEDEREPVGAVFRATPARIDIATPARIGHLLVMGGQQILEAPFHDLVLYADLWSILMIRLGNVRGAALFLSTYNRAGSIGATLRSLLHA